MSNMEINAETAIIYTRVSSLQQSRDDRVSLDEQRELCLAHAAGKGWDVVDAVREVKSAGTVRGRPVLLDAMRRVREGEANILLTYDLDRLTREQAGIVVIDEEIRRGNGRLEFVTQDFEDSATGRFMRSARAFAAEIELERISARSSMGRRGRVANGRLLVSKHSRYGYRYAGEKKGHYEIDPEQAPVVQRLFADFVAGKSISRIVTELNEEDVPTNSGEGRWHKPTVWNMLRSRAYLGEARMFRTRYCQDENGGKRRTWREEDETVKLPEGTIPAIIDQRTFERAQARLERNKSDLVRPTEATDALLRGGFVRCGACGRRMTVKRNHPRGRLQVRYICQYRDTCRSHVISAPMLDEAVWSRVAAILAEPERLRKILVVPGRDLPGEIAATEERSAELRREETGLVRLAARLEEGDDAAESLLAQVRETAQRRRVQEETRERLVAEARDEESRLARIEATIAAVEETSAAGTLDYEGKRQALSDLGVWVEVYPSWHESNFRWVMCAFEQGEHGPRWWVDGEVLNEAAVSDAASPSQPANRKSPRTRTARRTEPYSYACAVPSAPPEWPGARSSSAPAIARGRGRGAPARHSHPRDKPSGRSR